MMRLRDTEPWFWLAFAIYFGCLMAVKGGPIARIVAVVGGCVTSYIWGANWQLGKDIRQKEAEIDSLLDELEGGVDDE